MEMCPIIYLSLAVWVYLLKHEAQINLLMFNITSLKSVINYALSTSIEGTQYALYYSLTPMPFPNMKSLTFKTSFSVGYFISIQYNFDVITLLATCASWDYCKHTSG